MCIIRMHVCIQIQEGKVLVNTTQISYICDNYVIFIQITKKEKNAINQKEFLLIH